MIRVLRGGGEQEKHLRKWKFKKSPDFIKVCTNISKNINEYEN